ncbi:hypothetical protein [Flavihumibacter sp. UBA7668]|uniref:hypothetical protein n=1 Tax=Flavihumibacter sp. UBA7668 TaxID=1946542 RepID=UPI0025BCFB04|nr:hypothetical protein [Flavihumibacter sp. UBA7668]
MRVWILCVCWWFPFPDLSGQLRPLLAGTEFPLAGLGNPLFFRPVASFNNPALLADDNLVSSAEISMDQFTGIPATRRVDAHGSFKLSTESGIGLRIASIGQTTYRTNQLGIAYGRLLGRNSGSQTAWRMGLLFQFNQQKIIQTKAVQSFNAGLGSSYSGRKQVLAILLLVQLESNKWMAASSVQKTKEGLIDLRYRYNWSELVSTELAAQYTSSTPLLLQASVQYSFLQNAFLRAQWQLNPPMIGWEQGYRIKKYWLSVHCMRYPMIGWKAGMGMVWVGLSKNTSR